MLDDALVQCERFGKYENCAVSILVVLDDALVLKNGGAFALRQVCLNPCCAGRCSSTDMLSRSKEALETVSILVVLDDALVLSLITLWCDVQLTISILVVLDDALVLWNQRFY